MEYRRLFVNSSCLNLQSLLHGAALPNGADEHVDNAPQSWKASTAWEAKVKVITWRLDDKHPRFRHEQWKGVFQQQLSTTPFTIQAADPLFSLPLGEESVKFTYWMSKDAIWKRYSTLSQVAVLDPAEKEVSVFPLRCSTVSTTKLHNTTTDATQVGAPLHTLF